MIRPGLITDGGHLPRRPGTVAQFTGIRCQGQARTLSLVSEITRFYRQPSATSDLGRHRHLASGLPADPEALSAIVAGLLVHNFTAKVQGLLFPAERMSHMQTVGAEAILDNVLGLDPAPLGLERAAERRMVGFCYHFALLHCALLRATGTPARIRCGFAAYFEAQRWIDHWVVEYWDDDDWRLTDPQIGRSDLTSDDFQDGLSAWLNAAAAPRRPCTATENCGAGTNCGAA